MFRARSWRLNMLDSEQAFEFSSCLSWEKTPPLPRSASPSLLVEMPYCIFIQHSIISGVSANTAEKKTRPALIITPVSTAVAGTLETATQSKT